MKHTKILIFVLLSFVLAACNEDEAVIYKLEVNAYMRGMKVKEKVLYAPVLLAKVTDKTVSMTALDMNSKKYPLETYWNNSLWYRWLPKEEDYTATASTTMSFEFTAIPEAKTEASKEVKQTEKTSASDVPKPFEIKSFSYDAKETKLTVSWENSGADTYVIRISEKNIDTSPIFQSFNLVATKDVANLTATITPQTLKWFKSNIRNKTNLVLSVHAFNLVNNNSKKVLGEFVATTNFIWGMSSPSK